MKKIHIFEHQLLEAFGNDFEAGTDHPRWYDEKNGHWYMADWNGNYGFPFGFWPINESWEEQFMVGDSWSTHVNPCGKCAKLYVENMLDEYVGDDAYTIYDRISDLVKDIKQYGYTYNEDYDVYVSADGSDEIDLSEWTDSVLGDLNYNFSFYEEWVKGWAEKAIDGASIPSCGQIKSEIMESVIDEFSFNDKRGIHDALETCGGGDFESYFEKGRQEGRIWPRERMISFYPTEQPSRDDLEDIIERLSQVQAIGETYDALLEYHIIYEDWDDDYNVRGCTVREYINGTFGKEDEYDEDDDGEEVSYSREGVTKFVPHLANQKQKREFYKDFRDTRDRAVYVPKEKGANSLAAYHAMRYPYGENMKKNNKKLLK